MAVNLKPYVYKKGGDPALDQDFAAGKDYGWVRPGQTAVFWKNGLRWYAVPLTQVQRIFRRVEPVYGKLCCGGNSFIMEKLVLILKNGTELELYIGDDIEKKAAALLEFLQNLGLIRHQNLPQSPSAAYSRDSDESARSFS